ncbi:hypothetical protein LTR84_001424 [Exophiala bonariae]|uniref:BHLH domain-containing protein n=1 Tax=Exophiala bonariae TaxID=1690606 RepID=A0AAV9NCK1_9EURO|nr:hypothetical protein LTR84_001424 [Exophiala bonariae]
MPRPKAPPTPSSSTDLKALERNLGPTDMGSSFALPPPALRSEAQSTYPFKTTSNRGSANTRTPPVSPKDKPLPSNPRQKRTSSGMVKPTFTDSVSTGQNATSSAYALPPPPSRARKIIQMKPKGTSSNNHPSPDSDASYQPPASNSTSAAPSKGSTGHAPSATNSKRKQPSATSAAGRKIARKTAHSIIERRRRSKMNEEFGVLKDMIPACEGVEMHKLAILQAGIEYLRYLEGCVAQLKAENQNQNQNRPDPGTQEPDIHQEVFEHIRKSTVRDEEEHDESDEDDEDDEMGDDERLLERHSKAHINYSNQQRIPAVHDEWSFRDSRKGSLASQTSSAYPSPFLHGQPQPRTNEPRRKQGSSHQRPLPPVSTGSFSASPAQISTHAQSSSTTNTPTLLSPAFNSIHFSPDLTRTQTSGSIGSVVNSGTLPSTSSPWISLNQSSTSKPSPQMAPLPSPTASMHLPLPPLTNTLQLPPPFATGRENSRSPAMSDGSGTAEATATAALMMLNNDWRAGAGLPVSSRDHLMGGSRDKGKGMSVRDLLSS